MKKNYLSPVIETVVLACSTMVLQDTSYASSTATEVNNYTPFHAPQKSNKPF